MLEMLNMLAKPDDTCGRPRWPTRKSERPPPHWPSSAEKAPLQVGPSEVAFNNPPLSPPFPPGQWTGWVRLVRTPRDHSPWQASSETQPDDPASNAIPERGMFCFVCSVLPCKRQAEGCNAVGGRATCAGIRVAM